MQQPKTPNVYVQERSILPPSVAEVATAIPAFVGFTEKTVDAKGASLEGKPVRITSMGEYIAYFGNAYNETFTVDMNGYFTAAHTKKDVPDYILYQSVQHFFANGGGACYVVSTGKYGTRSTSTGTAPFNNALEALALVDEVTLFVLSDATQYGAIDYYALCQKAIAQCNDNMDRFALVDVLMTSKDIAKDCGAAREALPGDKYAAAYYPYLKTVMARSYGDDTVTVDISGALIKDVDGKPVPDGDGNQTFYGPGTTVDLEKLLKGDDILDDVTGKPKEDGNGNKLVDKTYIDTKAYYAIKAQLAKNYLVLPPTPAMAGIYAKTDKTRGVWKAPANVMVSSVLGPVLPISNDQQADMNVDVVAGKSINAIRSFTGKGTLVWGARTLAGNDNEWRYVSVRRLFNMVEESIQKATGFAVFEPNTPFTWLKLKTMMESYLENLWKQGAFFGDSPSQAFFVNVGLGQTMTEDDINNGIMHIEIGLAAVRPAEFIILTFSHKKLEG